MSFPSALALTDITLNSAIVSTTHHNNNAAIQTGFNALLTALSSGAYAAYTPTWAASGTAVSPGDRTITGRYIQLGNLVHAYGLLTMGSTTTYGTGSYTISLPVTASGNFASHNIPAGDAYAFDTSAPAFLRAIAVLGTTTTLNVQYPATYPTGVQAVVGQLVPWTWAAGDTLGWSVVYEAA